MIFGLIICLCGITGINAMGARASVSEYESVRRYIVFNGILNQWQLNDAFWYFFRCMNSMTAAQQNCWAARLVQAYIDCRHCDEARYFMEFMEACSKLEQFHLDNLWTIVTEQSQFEG